MALDPAQAANLSEIAERLLRPAGPRRTVRILERGAQGPVFEVVAGEGAAELPAEPQDRDTIYVVISGEGRLHCGEAVMECAAGDVLFAAAGLPRRFTALGRGFAIWRVLLGPS